MAVPVEEGIFPKFLLYISFILFIDKRFPGGGESYVEDAFLTTTFRRPFQVEKIEKR